MPSLFKPSRHLTAALSGAMCLCGLGMVGCQAERAVVAPVEPTWSYRDGSTQLSNNDTWNRMIPNAEVFTGKTQVASVEEPTK